jgi:hypothetical protein
MFSSKRSAGDIMADIEAMTETSPSERAYGAIFDGIADGLNGETLATRISEKTGLLLEPLLEKAAFLKDLVEIEAGSSAVRIALHLMVEGYACGLHLRVQGDGALVEFCGTHWRPLNEVSLRRQITQLVVKAPNGAVKAKLAQG